MMTERNYSVMDEFISVFDDYVKDFLQTPPGRQVDPADDIEHTVLQPDERRHSIGLMRVNHAGEVSAQALYKAQAINARDHQVKQAMQRSSEEEIDHLLWCEQRLRELGGHPSLLSPLWFLGSFSIGYLVGLMGDKWSLGFIVETERQVVVHLDKHLENISDRDIRSRTILQRMREDELHHASVAHHAGAIELPAYVKKLMVLCAGVMTQTAYWI